MRARGPRWSLRLAAAACVFLAADECCMLHERLGKRIEAGTGFTDGTPIEREGFSWVLVYAPAAAVAVWAWRRTLDRVLAESAISPEDAARIRRRRRIAAGAAVLVPVFEAVQGRLALGGVPESDTLLTCFEETVEIVALLAALSCNRRLLDRGG